MRGKRCLKRVHKEKNKGRGKREKIIKYVSLYFIKKEKEKKIVEEINV